MTERVAANIGEPENMAGFDDLEPEEQVGSLGEDGQFVTRWAAGRRDFVG